MITSGTVDMDEMTINKLLREEERKEEEIDSFAAELEADFESAQDLGTVQNVEDREVIDEDAEMYIDDIENEDALEEDYEREGEEGDF
jgi:hypothetical protein